MQTALRPNAQRAKIAIIMIWITLGLQILSFISHFFHLRFLVNIQNGEDYDIEEWQMSFYREVLIALLVLGVMFASSVTYIRWFRRAYFNLKLIDNDRRFSEWWAVLGWFIPIMWLFRPFQIIQEMFRTTTWVLKKNLPNFIEKKHSNLLGIWWTLWVISNLWDNFAGIYGENETIEQMISTTQLALWKGLITIPLAILAVRIIQEYSGMEGLLATPIEIFQEDQPVVPPVAESPSSPTINLEKGPSAE